MSQATPLRPSAVFDTYWRFAAERQAVLFRRLTNVRAPWTEDPILANYKFTNAYRASDRVSQYLIRQVIYRDDLPSTPDDVFFRIMIFKIFNKISTWEALETAVGQVTLDSYRFEQYDRILSDIIATRRPIYSAAYIMPPPGGELPRKHQNHLLLVQRMLADSLPSRLAECRSMSDAFGLLKEYPGIGDFLAYQYVTDLNYSELMNFSESDFVVPGPGARDGIRKCFLDTGHLSGSEIIRIMADRQELEFERLGLAFRTLWGRALQLIDCQNLFCEVDKYARVFHPTVAGISGRTRIKQRLSPQDSLPRPWYPPKWRLNDAIERWSLGHPRTLEPSMTGVLAVRGGYGH